MSKPQDERDSRMFLTKCASPTTYVIACMPSGGGIHRGYGRGRAAMRKSPTDDICWSRRRAARQQRRCAEATVATASDRDGRGSLDNLWIDPATADSASTGAAFDGRRVATVQPQGQRSEQLLIKSVRQRESTFRVIWSGKLTHWRAWVEILTGNV